MATAASRGLGVCQKYTQRAVLETYALPFFEFIKSAISRQRARLGSKFWGSTAFSVRTLDVPSKDTKVCHTYGYIVAMGFAPAPQKIQTDPGQRNVLRLLP